MFYGTFAVNKDKAQDDNKCTPRGFYAEFGLIFPDTGIKKPSLWSH